MSLWTACRNRVLKNNLSWGIRIKPGEVHARDSACVMIQAGSDDNYFADNDITHGGDRRVHPPLRRLDQQRQRVRAERCLVRQ